MASQSERRDQARGKASFAASAQSRTESFDTRFKTLQDHSSLLSFLQVQPSLLQTLIGEAQVNFGNRTIQKRLNGVEEIQRRLFVLDFGMDSLPMDQRFAFLFYEFWQANPINAQEKFGLSNTAMQEITRVVSEHPNRFERYQGFTKWVEEVQTVFQGDTDILTNPAYKFTELDYWIASQINDPDNLASRKTLQQIAADVPAELRDARTPENVYQAVDHRSDQLRKLGLIPGDRLDAQAKERMARILQLHREREQQRTLDSTVKRLSLDEIVAELGISRATAWIYLQTLKAAGEIETGPTGRRPGHTEETEQVLRALPGIIAMLKETRNLRWEFGEINDDLLAAEATKALGRNVSPGEIRNHVFELQLPSRRKEAVQAAKIAAIRHAMQEMVAAKRPITVEEILAQVPYHERKVVPIIKSILQEMGLPVPRYLR